MGNSMLPVHSSSSTSHPNTTMMFFIVQGDENNGYVPQNQIFTFTSDDIYHRTIADRSMTVFEREWRTRNPTKHIFRMEHHFYSPINISPDQTYSFRVLDTHRIIQEYYNLNPTPPVFNDVDMEIIDYEHINLLRRNGRIIYHEDNEIYNGFLLRNVNKNAIRLKVKDTVVRGFGLFADQYIPAGTIILEYVGDIYRIEEMPSAIDKSYIFNANNGWVIDSTASGNLSRFVNSICVRSSRLCNIESVCVKYIGSDNELKSSQFHRIFLVAIRNITPNQELLLNYEISQNYPCRCPLCIAQIK